jgi:hypothetical protein
LADMNNVTDIGPRTLEKLQQVVVVIPRVE